MLEPKKLYTHTITLLMFPSHFSLYKTSAYKQEKKKCIQLKFTTLENFKNHDITEQYTHSLTDLYCIHC